MSISALAELFQQPAIHGSKRWEFDRGDLPSARLCQRLFAKHTGLSVSVSLQQHHHGLSD